MNDMTTYGYIRVSTDKQNDSAEAQRIAIDRYCQFKDMEISHMIEDQDVSGKLPILDRPSGSTLIGIKDCCVVATKLDRLFRNVVDGLSMLELWEKNNVVIHIVDMGGNSFDTSTAIGKYIFTQLVAFAAFERNLIAERTTSGLAHKKSKGVVYSRPIFGYNVTDEGKLIINPIEQSWVHFIYTQKDIGWSLQQIADHLNNNNVKPKGNGAKFHPSTISYILSNDIYKQNQNGVT